MTAAQPQPGHTLAAEPSGPPLRPGLPALLGRIVLAAAAAILSINLWTGFPLLALWIGSRATGGELLSMTGVVVASLALVALLALGVVALARISLRYDRLTGRPPAVRQPPPWLLSMRASSAKPANGRREMNAIEMIVVAAVVAAFIALEVWFFFFATAPIG